MTRDEVRQIAGQAARRALHCPICAYPLLGDDVKSGRLRQLCNGHSRARYTAAHQVTLRLLAKVAAELAELIE